MVNYENGKIYKIVCNLTGEIYVGHTAQKYLSDRLSEHRSDYKKWTKGKYNYCTSFSIIERNNFQIFLLEKYPCTCVEELKVREQFYILNTKCVNKVVPLRTAKEYYSANKDIIGGKQKVYYEINKDKLVNYAKNYRDENKDKLKEYYENHKDKIKQYREENRDIISSKHKNWYEANKSEVLQRAKDYRKDNKDKISEANKKYREANQDKIKQYREDNKDRLSQLKKQYYQKNKDKVLEKVDCCCGASVCRASKVIHERSKKHQKYLKQMSNSLA
jgi:hypothetical protein